MKVGTFIYYSTNCRNTLNVRQAVHDSGMLFPFTTPETIEQKKIVVIGNDRPMFAGCVFQMLHIAGGC